MAVSSQRDARAAALRVDAHLAVVQIVLLPRGVQRAGHIPLLAERAALDDQHTLAVFRPPRIPARRRERNVALLSPAEYARRASADGHGAALRICCLLRLLRPSEPACYPHFFIPPTVSAPSSRRLRRAYAASRSRGTSPARPAARVTAPRGPSARRPRSL